MMAMKQALFLCPWVLGCMGAAFIGVGCEGTRTQPTGTNTGQGDTATPCFSSTQCATDEICLLGLCTQGTLNSGNNPVTPPTCNCTGLQTCNDSTQECTSAAICTNDNDCVAPDICARGLCLNPKPQCRFSDNECGTGNRCIEESMVCVPTTDCTNTPTNDCPPNLVCHSLFKRCVICESNNDCTSPQTCNSLRCVHTETCTQESSDSDNNTFANPPTLSIDSSGTVSNIITDVCIGDTDIFAINNLQVGDGLLLRATYATTLGTPHAQLFNESENALPLLYGNVTGHTVNGAFGTLLVGLEEVPSSTIYVKFTVTNGPIQLTFDIVTLPSGACFDDTFEPNSAPDDTATLIEQLDPVGIGHTITNCPGDADWFEAKVSAGKTLDVTVTTSSGTKPIVEIWPSALGNDPLKKDSSTTSPKTLSVQNNSGAEQTYLIGLLLPPKASVAGSKVEVQFTTTGP